MIKEGNRVIQTVWKEICEFSHFVTVRLGFLFFCDMRPHQQLISWRCLRNKVVVSKRL